MEDDLKNFFKAVTPYLVGAALLAAPYIIVTSLGPDDLKSWRAAYIAGGFGGLALEMLLLKWSLELPSVPKKLPKIAQIAPVGPVVDLGFMGRAFAGALAAPVFLILVRVLSEQPVAGVGDDVETIAWAVIVGAASPTVWQAAKGIVEARILGATNVIIDAQIEKLKKDVEDGTVGPVAGDGAQAEEAVRTQLVPRLEAIQEISGTISTPRED